MCENNSLLRVSPLSSSDALGGTNAQVVSLVLVPLINHHSLGLMGKEMVGSFVGPPAKPTTLPSPWCGGSSTLVRIPGPPPVSFVTAWGLSDSSCPPGEPVPAAALP